MSMPYSKNPHLPKVRMDAVKLVRAGWSTRQVARHFGYTHSAVVKWCARADCNGYWKQTVPTTSSRPRSHPKQLDSALVQQIVEYRLRTRRGAEFIHFMLQRDGMAVSLSSVKRTLSRHELTKYSKWKKWHQYPPRPLPQQPGELVEADTIHDGPVGSQFYIYTLLDVCSRWAYAEPAARISNWTSLTFIHQAQQTVPFSILVLQTDHGPEFAKWFTTQVTSRGVSHRHSRVRKPNDNAHLERFNRTIQEECIARLPRKLDLWQKEVPDYLHYYNTERPHMGINWQTPAERLQDWFQAID